MRLLMPMAFIVILSVAGCRNDDTLETSVPDVNIDLQVEPDPPAVGEATLLITLTDAEGAPIDNAAITVRGDMDHAGMAPVIVESTDGHGGEYRMPFAWSMGGGWVVEVTATLPDNRGIAQARFEFFVDMVPVDSIINTGGAGQDDMGGMDNMDDMETPTPGQ